MERIVTRTELVRRRVLTMAGVPASDPRETVLAQHPPATPDPLPPGPMMMIDPPSPLSPTARWRSYRDECRRFADAYPRDPRMAALLAAADTALAWRAALPDRLRFWPET